MHSYSEQTSLVSYRFQTGSPAADSPVIPCENAPDADIVVVEDMDVEDSLDNGTLGISKEATGEAAEPEMGTKAQSPDSALQLLPEVSLRGQGLEGILVPDNTIFNRAKHEDLEKVLQAFLLWKENDTADWSLQLHSQVVLGLAQAK